MVVEAAASATSTKFKGQSRIVSWREPVPESGRAADLAGDETHRLTGKGGDGFDLPIGERFDPEVKQHSDTVKFTRVAAAPRSALPPERIRNATFRIDGDSVNRTCLRTWPASAQALTAPAPESCNLRCYTVRQIDASEE
jgi:hypothetical protein